MQDLRALAIFVKVAERLSFVRAATDLGITQSGVRRGVFRALPSSVGGARRGGAGAEGRTAQAVRYLAHRYASLVRPAESSAVSGEIS